METALVTGASRGIGSAIMRELGINGYHVAVTVTRDEVFYPESTKMLLEAGISYAWYTDNIGRSEDRNRIVREAAGKLREIYVLINNAGVVPKIKADLLETTKESFDYVIGTSTRGNMFMTQATARQTMKQPVYGGKRGTITNISSCSSQASSVNRGEHCASKAGISMLTKLFVDRLAPEGIFVYKIRSGVIRTDITSWVEEKYTELIKRGTLPIVRWGIPKDVVKAVGAFYSDDFCYTTGNYINMDGGFHTRRLWDVISAYGY